MRYRHGVACGFGLLAMVAVSGNAGAAITAPVKIDFAGMVQAADYGAANLSPLLNGSCPGLSSCYFEDGMAIGVVDDPISYGEHLHRYSTGSSAQLQYHSDSSGIYIRAADGTAFSLQQMRFNAAIDAQYNVGYDADYNHFVAGDFWEILGFNTAENPNLRAGDGTNYATRVAYQQVANGFNGTLALDSAFNNINAFWIHFSGYPGVPQDGVDFGMKVDNIQLAAPVPLPATAWMMLTGLMGCLGFVRKKPQPV